MGLPKIRNSDNIIVSKLNNKKWGGLFEKKIYNLPVYYIWYSYEWLF